jgi:uncharacterized protein (DUF2384 family)
MRYLLTIVVLGWFASIALASELPTRIDIEYALKGSIGKGKAHESIVLQKEDDIQHYAISSEISASGLLSLIKPGSILRHSQGIVKQNGLQPLSFSDQRGDKPVRKVEFDWSGQRILYRHKGREMVENLPVGALDKLSLPYQFMFMPPPQKVLTIHETDHRRLVTANYSVSQEKLDTPMGTLSTIVLTKQKVQGDSFKKKIWLAVDHHMLPVRIVATEKGGLEVDQIVTKINYIDNGGMQ